MSENSKIQWTSRTGHALGALKSAAKKIGISFDEYLKRCTTEKWCTLCKAWHPKESFAADSSRYDGLTSSCTEARYAKGRARYQRKPRKRHGWLTPTRDGDKKQARRRVNYLVEQGRIPHPDDLPCTDCADEVFGVRFRHEYDHARGYDGENQLYVEAVCSRCHHLREEERRSRAAGRLFMHGREHSEFPEVANG